MKKDEQQKYRQLYRDVLRGYSELTYGDKIIYVKHFRECDLGDIEDIDEKALAEAKEKGVPTEEEKLELLIKENLWEEKKEKHIKVLKEEMVSAKQTMSKLVLKNQINFHQKLLDKKEEELKDLLAEKRELIGYTAETYVEKKVSAEYLRHSLYKDTNIKEKFYSSEEFDEVSDTELMQITILNNYVMSLLVPDEIKNLAATAFFINGLAICTKNPMTFFGKPVAEKTNYQIDLFSNGLRYLSVLEEGKNPTQSDMESIVSLRKWYEAMIEARHNKSIKINQNDKENQGATIFGADKQELKNLLDTDNGDETVDLSKEAKKRGGVLTMGDMIEIHGHGKKGENIKVR